MSPPYTSGLAARQAVGAAIYSGQGLVHFTGHSNPYSWFGDINVANPQDTIMLDIPTMQSLTNTGNYPTLISMTCYTGYFVIPGLTILDEALIRADAKGAVATWSPTGKGVASGHDLLDAGFFQALAQNPALPLGLAADQAKVYLYASSGGLHRELIDTFVLFGDPAMPLAAGPHSVTLPLVRR